MGQSSDEMEDQSSSPAGACSGGASTTDPPPTTRLAPSPTGALHLGNARTFFINWLLARQRGWRIVLRIEDLDGPRNKPGADRDAIDVLQWLGLTWDEGPHYQARDLRPYVEAISALARAGRAYPSQLTRAEIEAAATAPQVGAQREARYPPEWRPQTLGAPFDPHLSSSWRFVTPDRHVAFDDHFAGPQRMSPVESIGDFAIWTARNEPAYQLAVVVDDHRQGVTHVVRADDLLDSAGRQLLLYEALGYAPAPHYFHLPLVKGVDGRRLAKRHGDTRIARYRDAGTSPEKILGLLAWLCGQIPQRAPVSLDELLQRFDLSTMPREPVVFGPEDDQWLLSKS